MPFDNDDAEALEQLISRFDEEIGELERYVEPPPSSDPQRPYVLTDWDILLLIHLGIQYEL